jgi:LemA protein
MYNNLVQLRNRVKNSYAQIDVQLKRRNDLIPNLVETVKGYAAHEKGVLEEVTKARTGVMNASNIQETSEADNQLTGALKTLFAVAENYPELKANSNFQQLQSELSETEDKISYSRQFYNDTVLKYNNACQTFPSSMLARLFGFSQEEFFKAPDAEKEVPEVKF